MVVADKVLKTVKKPRVDKQVHAWVSCNYSCLRESMADVHTAKIVGAVAALIILKEKKSLTVAEQRIS